MDVVTFQQTVERLISCYCCELKQQHWSTIKFIAFNSLFYSQSPARSCPTARAWRTAPTTSSPTPPSWTWSTDTAGTTSTTSYWRGSPAMGRCSSLRRPITGWHCSGILSWGNQGLRYGFLFHVNSRSFIFTLEWNNHCHGAYTKYTHVNCIVVGWLKLALHTLQNTYHIGVGLPQQGSQRETAEGRERQTQGPERETGQGRPWGKRQGCQRGYWESGEIFNQSSRLKREDLFSSFIRFCRPRRFWTRYQWRTWARYYSGQSHCTISLWIDLKNRSHEATKSHKAVSSSVS